MLERKLVLYDPQTNLDPLYLEFKDEIPVSNEDQIVCNIPLDIAYAFLEAQNGSYFEEHIKIYSDVEKYLLKLKEER